MSERTEALRRFPPANPQRLVPMAEGDKYEQLAYKVLESPQFWLNAGRIKALSGLTYWTEVYKVINLLEDEKFRAEARKHYEGLPPEETTKVALKNIKGVDDLMKWFKGGIPQTGKKPWEMTWREFYNPQELPLSKKGYTAIRGPGGEIEKVITPAGEELFPLDHLGVKWGRRGNRYLHEAIVRQAFQRGLTIPPEVLAEYDHLKQYPEAAPATLYSSPSRKIKDELERLKNDPERPRFVKEIKDEIKRRERGKIKKFPDVSLTELREIIKEEENLYR